VQVNPFADSGVRRVVFCVTKALSTIEYIDKLPSLCPTIIWFVELQVAHEELVILEKSGVGFDCAALRTVRLPFNEASTKTK